KFSTGPYHLPSPHLKDRFSTPSGRSQFFDPLPEVTPFGWFLSTSVLLKYPFRPNPDPSGPRDICKALHKPVTFAYFWRTMLLFGGSYISRKLVINCNSACQIAYYLCLTPN